MQLRSRRLLILGLVLAALATGGGIVWQIARLNGLARAGLATGATPVAVQIGGETLTVPANRLRFADQRRAGTYARVELELKWPEWRALEPDDPALKTTARDGQLVFVTIEPRDTDLDTADRIATIYQKFLMPADAASGTSPEGLIRQSFVAGTAYEGEMLYFEPGSVHPFAARCFPPDKGEAPLSCLRDVRLGQHLLATVRFPVKALDQWRALRDRIDQLIADLTGNAGG